VRLRLFPGHTTTYYLALRNRADDAKKVRADLYAIPALPGYAGPPGRILDD